MEDVAIIGGSFAGLTAAVQLARTRRRITVFDTRLPRNRFAGHAHNVLGFDGTPPAAIVAAARANFAAYPTASLVDSAAVAVSGAAGDFRITAASGEVVAARRVILAYGVADQLPAIPGFAECWGDSIFHCPYCHGYEVAGQRLGILYSGPGSLHAPVLLGDWSDALTLFDNGLGLPEGEAQRLAARGVDLREGRIAAFLHDGGRLRAVQLADGSEVALDAILANPPVRPSAALHEALGVATADAPMGPYVKVDDEGRTNIEGIFAAGDLAGPRHAINIATYTGTLAAVGCHRSLLDWG